MVKYCARLICFGLFLIFPASAMAERLFMPHFDAPTGHQSTADFMAEMVRDEADSIFFKSSMRFGYAGDGNNWKHADYVLVGTLKRASGLWQLRIKAFETRTDRLLVETTLTSERKSGLGRSLPLKARKLLKTFKRKTLHKSKGPEKTIGPSLSKGQERKQARESVSNTAVFQALSKSSESSSNSLWSTHSSSKNNDALEALSLQKSTQSSRRGTAAVSGTFRVSGNKEIGKTRPKQVRAVKLKSTRSIKGASGKAPTGKMKSTVQTTSTGNCKRDINKVVKRKRGQVKYCYDSRLKQDLSLKGRVVVEASIGLDGKVFAFDTPSNTTNDTRLIKCIERKIKKWRFPKDCEDDLVLTFILDSVQ